MAGVVSDLHHFGPHQPVRPMTYLPASQEPWNGINRGLSVVIRSDQDPGSLEAPIRAAIAGVGTNIPQAPMRTLRDLVADRVAPQTFRLALAAGFGAIAFIISLVGLAGVLSFSVSRRRREIGVRLALGAAASTIHSMVLKEGFTLFVRGLVLGILIAVPVATLLTRFLFEVEPWDPVALAAVSGVLGLGDAIACYPPALRASRSDPISALKSD